MEDDEMQYHVSKAGTISCSKKGVHLTLHRAHVGSPTLPPVLQHPNPPPAPSALPAQPASTASGSSNNARLQLPGFGANLARQWLDGTDRKCGKAWLLTEQHLDLQMIINEHVELVQLGAATIHKRMDIKIVNKGAGGPRGCNPLDLTIWISVEGPESMAQMATPHVGGLCQWSGRFDFTLPGKFALSGQLIFWGGRNEFDNSKCEVDAGFGQLWVLENPAEHATDFSLQGPSAFCCEMCTRDPSCTHYVAKHTNSGGVDTGYQAPGGHEGQHGCLLANNRSGFVRRRAQFTDYGDQKAPNGRALVDSEAGTAGKSRGPGETGHFLGSLYNFFRWDCSNKESSLGESPATTFTVTTGATPSVCVADPAVVSGMPASNRTSAGCSDVCPKANSLPHDGRWVDITDQMAARVSVFPHALRNNVQNLPAVLCRKLARCSRSCCWVDVLAPSALTLCTFSIENCVMVSEKTSWL
jgi:hypothetical protein